VRAVVRKVVRREKEATGMGASLTPQLPNRRSLTPTSVESHTQFVFNRAQIVFFSMLQCLRTSRTKRNRPEGSGTRRCLRAYRRAEQRRGAQRIVGERDVLVLSAVAFALLLMVGSYVAAKQLFWQWW
jgi:hypothetical protein